MADETRRLLNRIDRTVTRVIVTLATEATANLIEATPVDTGWARANWIPSIGTPPSESSDMPTTEDARRASTPGRQGQQQSGTASLLGYRIGLGDLFIVNQVPYIGRLNDGHSRQAPAGFVQTAIMQAITTTAQRFTVV